MSYVEAMAAAGATIHAHDSFGSYQGDGWVKLTFGGVTGWVNYRYGSCSGCDAFQAQFGYNDDEYCASGHHYLWDEESDCEGCKEVTRKYRERLAEFGMAYLEHIMTQEEAEGYAKENIDWDSEAENVLKFITDNA